MVVELFVPSRGIFGTTVEGSNQMRVMQVHNALGLFSTLVDDSISAAKRIEDDPRLSEDDLFGSDNQFNRRSWCHSILK